MKKEKKQDKEFLDDGFGPVKEEKAENPQKTVDVNDFISKLALKNLAKTSIQVTADPYSASLPSDQPYPILNKQNRMIGGSYAGQDNLDAGNVSQYALAWGNKWLNTFDSAMLRVEWNYLYIPKQIGSAKQGQAIVDGLAASVADIESILNSTTFIDQAINNYEIVTDQPCSETVQFEDVTTGSDSSQVTTRYITSFPDVLNGIALYYQKFLQNVLLSFNYYNAYRAKWGPMMRMEYDRHTSNLYNLFGMYQKNAFNTLWWGIAKDIHREYVDKDWMLQTNTTFLIPSRKANDIIHPLVELVGCIAMPDRFRMFINSGGTRVEVFDSNKFTATINGVTYNHQTLFERLNILLSAESTLYWARTYGDPDAASSTTVTVNGRFNEVKDILDTLTLWIQSFKKSFTDFKTALEVLNKSGVNKWKTKYTPRISRRKDSITMNNLTVNDIVSLAMCGPTKLELNPATFRYRTYSLWNKFTGIPNYDAKSGGAFLTMSLKTIANHSSSNDYLTRYMPIGIQLDPSSNKKMYLLSRRGREVGLDIVTSKFVDNVETRHLVPLTTQDNLEFKAPYLATNGLTNDEISCFIWSAQSLFDIFKVGSKFYVNNDIFAVYEFELNNVSSEIINYARARGPFWTQEDETTFGFVGLTRKIAIQEKS